MRCSNCKKDEVLTCPACGSEEPYKDMKAEMAKLELLAAAKAESLRLANAEIERLERELSQALKDKG